MSGSESRKRRDKMRGKLGVLLRDIKAASVIIELRDARAPELTSVRDYLGPQAPKCKGIILSKADMAEKDSTRQWIEHFRTEDIPAIALDLRQGRANRAKLVDFVNKLATKKSSALGVARVAIVGLPNVGKSTLINTMLGRNKAATGNRPGVTKGKQWIRLAEDVYLLDTPGVIQLFGGIENKLGRQFFKLIMCNVVPTGQYDSISAIEDFFMYLKSRFSAWPFRSYREDVFSLLWSSGIEKTLEAYAAERNMVGTGGMPDGDAAARAILADFRRGKLGRVSLELPGQGRKERDS